MIFAHKSEGTDSPNHRFRQTVVDKHNEFRRQIAEGKEVKERQWYNQ